MKIGCFGKGDLRSIKGFIDICPLKFKGRGVCVWGGGQEIDKQHMGTISTILSHRNWENCVS